MRYFGLTLVILHLSAVFGQGDNILDSFFPPLTEDSKEYGLWPLLTPLLNVSPQCRTDSIRYANDLLEVSTGRSTSESWMMFESTGKLPMEGMFKDTVQLRLCDIVPKELYFLIDCKNPAIAAAMINMPVGSTFSYGSAEDCLKAQGKHCLALLLPSEGKMTEKTLREIQSSEYVHNLTRFVETFPQTRMLMGMNHDLIRTVLNNTQLILTTTKEDPDISQIVLLIILVWAGVQGRLQMVVGFGVCVPNSCVYEDIGANLNTFANAPIFNMQEVNAGSPNRDFFCKENNAEIYWTNVSTVITVAYCVLGCFLVVGTAADILQHVYRDDQYSSPASFFTRVLLAFSLYSNFKSLMSTRESKADALTCLHGMRFLSMSWVVLGHNFLFLGSYLNRKSILPLYDIYEGGLGLAFEAVLNAVPSVDSFFLFSGLLVAYLTLKDLDKSKGQVKLVMFYVHRYIRLTVPLAFFMAAVIAYLPAIASYTGTQISEMMSLEQSKACHNDGWSVLMYLNNFFENHNICIGVTWYTCDDMVFFWLSLLIIYPMWSNSIVGGLVWWFLWLVAATFPTIYQIWKFDLGLDGGYVDGSDPLFFARYGRLPGFYEAPWNRFQPYLIGILLGYILHYTRGREVRMPRLLNLVGWLVASVSGFTVVYGTYSEHERGRWTTAEYVIYNGFHRIGWAGALAWVIFSCSKGYGGVINDFLSWRFFLPLSRISFMTYLLHSIVIIVAGTSFYSFSVDLTWELLTMFYFGNLLMSMAIAFALTLVIESPFVKLEKLLLGKLMSQSKSEKLKM